MRLFGPTQEDIWKILSNDIGAEFNVSDSAFKKYEVIKKFHNWIMVLDTCNSNDRNKVTFTRIRCTFLNKHGFKFKVFGEYFNNYFPNFFDMQDIKVNYDNLSDKFITRSNSEVAIKMLLKNSIIRELLSTQKDILLEIAGEEGCEVSVTANSTLCVKIAGIIKNNEVLKELFELVGECLLEIEKINNEIQNLQVNNFTHFDVIKNSVKNTLLESAPYKNLKKDIINNVNKVIDKTSHYSHNKNQGNKSKLLEKNHIKDIAYTENRSSEINSKPIYDYTDNKSLNASDDNNNKKIQTSSIDTNNPKVDVNNWIVDNSKLRIDTSNLDIDTSNLNIDTSNLKIDDSYLKIDDSYLKNDSSYLKNKE